MIPILVLMVAMVGAVFFGITQPIKKPKYDSTVKYVSKLYFSKIIALNILLFTMVGFIIQLVVYTKNGYSRFLTILEGNELLEKALGQITIPQSVTEQVTIPVIISTFLMTLATIAILYTAILAIYRLISTTIGYKQQKENEAVKTLLKSIKNENTQQTINSYFEIKEKENKHELFISQWKGIVNILLLGGELAEAESLNSYVHEREKYAIFGKRIIRSNCKVSLFDYEGLQKDKDRGKSKIAKHTNKKEVVHK